MKREIDLKKDLKLNIRSPFTIADVEITNSIATDSGMWNYHLGNIFILGILREGKIIQVYRTPDDDIEIFKEECKQLIKGLSLHSFNQNMEQLSLKGFLGLKSLFVAEIKPFKGRGWTKDKFYEVLITNKLVKPITYKDPLNGQGARCIEAFANNKIQDALEHNVCCLLKEYHILANKEKLFELFSSSIDEQGWFH